MGGDGMLSLSWNNHSSTFCHMLASLRRLERFTDVTISCDGEFYCVHKFVLSMCSDYFTKIFDRTPCKHPVIVLKDVQRKDMEALLNYMYIGQVSVAQNDLAQLIKVAELLQIKGLAVPDEPLKGFWKGRPHMGEKSGSQWKLKKKSDGEKDIYILENKAPNTGEVTIGAKKNSDANKGQNVKDEGMQNVDGNLAGNGEHQSSATGKNDDEENGNHSGLIRIGSSIHNKGHSEALTVNPIVDEEDVELTDLSCGSNQPVIQIERINEKSVKNRGVGMQMGPGGSGQYHHHRDARHHGHNQEAMNPSIEEIYKHGNMLKPQFPHGEESGGGGGIDGNTGNTGNTDGNALSLNRFKYDKAYQNQVRTAFCQNFPQDNTNSDSQPGPSLFYGMNEITTNRDMQGSATVETLQSFTDEAFQNPYFLFQNSEQNSECLSPKLRPIEKKNRRPYACTQCRYSTSSRSNLVIHMRTHTGERPFTCPDCSFSASFEYNLKVHMRTHTGEKPFDCPHCPVKFAQRSHLKNHIVTHTGEKPYVCEFCSMRFSRRSNLRRHLIKHQE